MNLGVKRLKGYGGWRREVGGQGGRRTLKFSFPQHVFSENLGTKMFPKIARNSYLQSLNHPSLSLGRTNPLYH